MRTRSNLQMEETQTPNQPRQQQERLRHSPRTPCPRCQRDPTLTPSKVMTRDRGETAETRAELGRVLESVQPSAETSSVGPSPSLSMCARWCPHSGCPLDEHASSLHSPGPSHRVVQGALPVYGAHLVMRSSVHPETPRTRAETQPRQFSRRPRCLGHSLLPAVKPVDMGLGFRFVVPDGSACTSAGSVQGAGTSQAFRRLGACQGAADMHLGRDGERAPRHPQLLADGGYWGSIVVSPRPSSPTDAVQVCSLMTGRL